MIIRDKQALRRCVKQAVRRAEVVETCLRFDVASGALGVDAARAGWPDAQGTPFYPDAAALYAALDALELPGYDLRRAQAEIETYERGAYLRALLDAMRARRVLVRVPLARAGEAFLGDDRLEPLLAVDGAAFAPGRYGVDYARAAQGIAGAMRACGARALLAEDVPLDALRWALLPLSEDEGVCLHAGLRGADEATRFAAMMDGFPGARALVWAVGADAAAERALISASKANPRITVRLTDLSHLGMALEALGTRFVAYAACASQPELMTGRWLCFKERLHPLLAEQYLPLARAGYELTSEQIEADVRALLGG